MASSVTLVPLPPDLGPELLAAGVDANGRPPELVVDTEGGSPLRCCLRESRPGERLVLASVSPPGPTGPYQESGPLFVHAEPCAGPEQSWPAWWATRDQVLRAYDADGRILGGAVVDAGGDLRGRAAQLLDDPTVAFLHARNVVYGCFMVRLER